MVAEVVQQGSTVLDIAFNRLAEGGVCGSKVRPSNGVNEW